MQSGEHHQRDERGKRLRGHAARGAAGALGVALVVVAATGWLYIIRNLGVLAAGPHLGGALPLQQLARTDAQPLLRLAVVWVPAGAVAALLLSRWAGLSWPAVTAVIAGVTFALLVLAGAVSDAIAVSEPLRSHLTPQLTRGGTLVAVGLMLLGAAPVLARRR